MLMFLTFSDAVVIIFLDTLGQLFLPYYFTGWQRGRSQGAVLTSCASCPELNKWHSEKQQKFC